MSEPRDLTITREDAATRGRYVGKRAGGYRIIPLCPYVKVQYQRHPAWADVMQG